MEATPLKTVALHAVHQQLGAKIVPFAGYAMPVRYSSDLEEHHTVRRGVGIFDVSHMGEFRVRGPHALDLIQRTTSNDASKLQPGKAQYSCLPNAEGGIVDDLLHKYPLAKKMAGYSFFSYQVHEALHLSAGEEELLNGLLATLQREHAQPIDAFSQDVLVAQLEVLLTYANRFYHRQFLTRRPAEHDLLSRFEALLTAYFAQSDSQPLPTVQHFADALHVSPAYLGDMLRSLTGQTTQQHIHQALIERAKQLLRSTSLTINETAFRLGFEYPQYFSRLFKNKTGLTPAAFRFSAQ